jgi:hypothetical protein
MDLYSTSKTCAGHYTLIALLLNSIWKTDNVFITVANTTIIAMVINVGYMPLNQLYFKTP